MDNKELVMTSGIKSEMISQSLVRFLFSYLDGELYWKRRPATTVDINKPAGSVNGGGFIDIRINKRRYRADMLIWIYHYDLPDDQSKYTKKLIHKDGNKRNSKIENLELKLT